MSYPGNKKQTRDCIPNLMNAIPTICRANEAVASEFPYAVVRECQGFEDHVRAVLLY